MGWHMINLALTVIIAVCWLVAFVCMAMSAVGWYRVGRMLDKGIKENEDRQKEIDERQKEFWKSRPNSEMGKEILRRIG